MEDQVGDFKISRRQIIHTFEFNNDYDNVEFTHVMTTDIYRRGRPYKLFNSSGQSQVQITFDLPEDVKKPTSPYYRHGRLLEWNDGFFLE